jgi:hypothetical protein
LTPYRPRIQTPSIGRYIPGPELRLVLQGAAAPPPKPDPLLLRRLIEADDILAAITPPCD